MKVFTSNQIREIDKYTIANEPIASIDLMERAALALSYWFRVKYEAGTQFVFLAGPGNNGGDAWALARILFHHGYENIRLYLLNPSNKLSADAQINRQRLVEETDIRIKEISDEDDFPFISENDFVVDALFGSGLSRPLNDLAKTLVEYVNACKKASVVSIDIPSGLFGEDNTNNHIDAIIKANITLTFQFPKIAFFFAENDLYIGKWEVLSIGLHEQAIADIPSDYRYFTVSEAKNMVLPRQKYSHKGTYGHALIVAGCYGMMGASVLATRAAVSAGAGLITAHIPRLGYEIIQVSVPEALTSLDESDLIFTEVSGLEKYTAIAVGPGLNTKKNTVNALKDLLKRSEVPVVIDADGLNILSQNKGLLDELPVNTILTPHPGEFDRLTQLHDTHFSRVQSQITLSKKSKVIIVLKGAHTSISMPDGTIYFNSTGNPGMAKGGSGDVLTGVICSLLAQRYSAKHATLLGVFVHGLAGDMALERKGFHALTPSDIIRNLGRAFRKIE